jgi:coenzyme PQQ precursor peptide PqqA
MEAAPRRLSNLLADADRRSSGNPYPKYAAFNVRPRLKVPQPKGIDAPLWFPAKEKRFNWRTFCSPLIEELVLSKGAKMAWKAPKIVEVSVGMEINMYMCAARK